MLKETRQKLDGQKMKDTGYVLGFFNAYSKLQTGVASYRARQDAGALCGPAALTNPKLPHTEEDPDPRILDLNEEECRCLYTEGWKEGYTQGTYAYETQDLELIGEIARLAGEVSTFHSYTTAENDARDCKVVGEVRKHFITNWRQTGGDKRKVQGI